MRELLSCLSLLLVLMAPVAAQDVPAPEPPKAEDNAEDKDARKDDQKTKTKPEEAQAPDIIETTDKASEDLPLIFPADI
jgi:hypothetical protein